MLQINHLNLELNNDHNDDCWCGVVIVVVVIICMCVSTLGHAGVFRYQIYAIL